jgi:hexokinase
MESDPTDGLLTIIGVFTPFFALETTLPERSRQSFCALAKLIGRRLSTCGIMVIVEFREEGCLVGAAHRHMIGVSALFILLPASMR